jgi:ATP-dependent Lon protease
MSDEKNTNNKPNNTGKENKDSQPPQNTRRELPVLPSEDMVLFPHMVVPWIVEAPHLVRMIDDALATDRTIVIALSKKGEEGSDTDMLHEIGTMGIILRMMKNEEGHAKLIIQGASRVRLKEITSQEPYIKAITEPVHDIVEKNVEIQAMVVNLRQTFSRILDLATNLPAELGAVIMNIDDPGALADIAITHMNIEPAVKQEILEAVDVKERLEKALVILSGQLEIMKLGNKIQTQVKDKVEQTQKEFFLREQMKVIKQELGETDNAPDEIEELEEKLKAKKLPEDAMREAERELKRLARMHPSSSEYSVARTYIEWMIDIPWNEETEDDIDLKRAEDILNRDHYDLEKIKTRILEYLAVRKLKPDSKGTIICFAGPTGTGKTSLGKSIARSIGRKFQRIALGGTHDEAEIRGHRRTYVGAMPGRIIQAIKKAGVRNPVIMLDEIDKLGSDFRGDPASALLEVLDPEQNSTFTDNYLGVEFDLSNVIFLATANMLDTIPGPLLDRLEVLELSGYTTEEKAVIARKYLLPRQLEAHGLKKRSISIDKKTLIKIITSYTREAGVRNLERQLAKICRKVARQVAEGNSEKAVIRTKNLSDYLGNEKYFSEVAERTSIPGVATGLAWTPVGGDILFIEATSMPGSGKLILTGKLGDVMKESATAAMSYIKSRHKQFGIDAETFNGCDIHLHVPSGAIPKDGPSAGVAISMALLSLFRDVPVKSNVAMTGEITLRGLVLPVGGIKEKFLAAHRAGIKEVILPKRNEKDLDELPEQVRQSLVFHPVNRINDAIDIVFQGLLRKRGRKKNSANPQKKNTKRKVGRPKKQAEAEALNV